MKLFGAVLIAIGLALLFFIVYNIIKEKGRTVSPLPEDKGIKVIFVTPTE